jgi:nitric oxide reductase subunit C
MLHKKVIILLASISLLLAACGQQSIQVGNPEAGEKLFHQVTIEAAPGCITCHSTEPNKVIVGPSLAGIASRAGERIPGQTAEEYLTNCILNPNVYVVDGFPISVMYQKYKEALTDEQVRDLTAYLSTLK